MNVRKAACYLSLLSGFALFPNLSCQIIPSEGQLSCAESLCPGDLYCNPVDLRCYSSWGDAGSDEEDAGSDSGSATDFDTTGRLENTPSACSDSADNDGDGLADCADSDCQSTTACACDDGAVKKVPCGNLCGEAEVICVDKIWSSPGPCQNEGTCKPGDTQEQECKPSCQTKTKICETDCTWGDWGACEEIPDCGS